MHEWSLPLPLHLMPMTGVVPHHRIPILSSAAWNMALSNAFVKRSPLCSADGQWAIVQLRSG
eukprot:14695879-Heterocapsa_arctica.AAC.1